LTSVLGFERWHQEIIALLRQDFGGELQDITLEEVDWHSWWDYFAQGRSPRAAIERALERDI
jgi:hypothetical protein